MKTMKCWEEENGSISLEHLTRDSHISEEFKRGYLWGAINSDRKRIIWVKIFLGSENRRRKLKFNRRRENERSPFPLW